MDKDRLTALDDGSRTRNDDTLPQEGGQEAGQEAGPEAELVVLPWNYAAIIQYADLPSSTTKIDARVALEKGIMIRNRRQIYRVDSGKNWFTILPKSLTIASSEDPSYWNELTLKDDSGRIEITVVKLRSICWLDISGKFQTVTLSQDTDYEIVLHIKLGEDDQDGFDAPVNFRITLPGGHKVERQTNFHQLIKKNKMKRGSWEDISLYEFHMTTSTVGEVQFCLYEHRGKCKSGIELGGVSFKPKVDRQDAATPQAPEETTSRSSQQEEDEAQEQNSPSPNDAAAPPMLEDSTVQSPEQQENASQEEALPPVEHVAATPPTAPEVAADLIEPVAELPVTSHEVDQHVQVANDKGKAIATSVTKKTLSYPVVEKLHLG